MAASHRVLLLQPMKLFWSIISGSSFWRATIWRCNANSSDSSGAPNRVPCRTPGSTFSLWLSKLGYAPER
eukprot:1879444-Amphidinium_carterae.1